MFKTKFIYSLLALLAIFALNTQSHAEEIPTKPEEIRPIMVGQSLPPITLTGADNKPFNLNKAIKQQPTLLVFYRGGWCPYCNTHLANLRKIEGDLKALGFQILAVSPDLPEFLQQTEDKQKLNYTLLSDSQMGAARALGIAFKVDKSTRTKYQEYGIDLEKNSGEKHHLLPVPAAFILNTDGQVTFSFVAPDYTVRIDNEVLLAAAKSGVR